MSAALPGVQPMSQTIPGFVSESWVGMLAPARTPSEIVARLHADVVKVLKLSEVRDRFREQGLEVVGSTPAEFDRRIRAELERWGKIIRTAHITLE
jgi:tripartite-type tricarboxylate transporter receptor subunit TctC